MIKPNPKKKHFWVVVAYPAVIALSKGDSFSCAITPEILKLGNTSKRTAISLWLRIVRSAPLQLTSCFELCVMTQW